MSEETTAADFLNQAAQILIRAGNQDPRREARMLLAHVEGVSPEKIIAYPERIVSNLESALVAVERRAGGEPISRILGRRGFWKDDFLIGADTLDPRPDTETVVEDVLDRLPEAGTVRRILDLGVGSGCLLLSLLREFPNAAGFGVDISQGAVDATFKNARSLGMEDRVDCATGHWFDAVSGRFDLIVSNPPYIPSAEIATLEREVRDHDPVRALDGGDDGLDCYREIVPNAVNFLEPGGFLALEVGAGQADDVSDFCMNAGFSHIQIRRDLGGIARCVSACWAG